MQKKVVLTICSINYLAQANSLGESLLEHNPDYSFVIGLVDRLDKSDIPSSDLPNYTILELHQIGIPDFEDMCDRYNITELNTAVKPFYLQYIYKNYPEVEILHYFDPDIIVFQPLTEIEKGLGNNSLFLTPHILSPFPDECRPQERDLLNTGMYNLGFIGTKRSKTTETFLQWWAERLYDHCYIDLENGMFVDQNWVNFAPIYYEDVFVSRHKGLNMAYWNIHERSLSETENGYFVNEKYPLIFFHFSGYEPSNPTEISKYQNRYTFFEKSDVASIFDFYAQTLIKNGQETYKKYPCFYIKPEVPQTIKRYKRVRKYLTLPFRRFIDWVDNVKI
ncbi:glycosyl transferase [Sandaracinomonas limnophila]|uniref:Glycosyl transferase n=1 Tax=Sandaracinomonas limnophila TaxID=1862386 RepID=A0A437PPM6_9BACT|nr:glycosyl transferase [Sandaracinomonas limnophila]RVU24177.1 glycosyl transferase [Sandaracinomonas limnophila]